MVKIQDLSGVKPEKKYTYDHAFWSHDEFYIDENGTNIPDGSKYTDQAKVWELLGKPVLDKAWNGLNNTIFAYG